MLLWYLILCLDEVIYSANAQNSLWRLKKTSVSTAFTESLNHITNGSNFICIIWYNKIQHHLRFCLIFNKINLARILISTVFCFPALVSLKHWSHNIKATSLLVIGNTNSPGVSHGRAHTQENMLGSTLLAYLWSAISLPVVWIWWSPVLQSLCVCSYCICVCLCGDVMESTCTQWGGEIFWVRQWGDVDGWMNGLMERLKKGEWMTENM